MMVRLTITALTLGVTSSLCAQQRVAPADPMAVMAAFMDDLAHERWVQAAGYLDLTALEAQRKAQLRFFREPPQPHELTVDEFMRSDPEMPRAVAEYHVARAKTHPMDLADALSLEFAGVRDTATFASLAPLYLGALWLEAQSSGYQLRRSLRENAAVCASMDTTEILKTLHPEPPRQILGAVIRGDTAFVLHRDTTEHYDAETLAYGLQVAALRRINNQWRILPSERALGGRSGMSFVCGAIEGPRDR